MEAIEGFEIPIHRSLTDKILMGGVPRNVAILNGALGAVLFFYLQSWYAVPVCVLIHILATIATKHDPDFLDCFKRQMKQKPYYSA